MILAIGTEFFATNSDFLYIFETKYAVKPWIFQNINSVRSRNNLSLKYDRFTGTPSDHTHIGIRKFESVAKTQFLSKNVVWTR